MGLPMPVLKLRPILSDRNRALMSGVYTFRPRFLNLASNGLTDLSTCTSLTPGTCDEFVYVFDTFQVRDK